MLTVVIARETEDLSWLDQLPAAARVYVYNRGAPMSTLWRREDVVQVRMAGGEGAAAAYLQHMSLYHQANQAGWTVFCPAQVFEVAPEFLSSLACVDHFGPVQVLSAQAAGSVPSQMLRQLDARESLGPCRLRAERFSLKTWQALALNDERLNLRVAQYRHQAQLAAHDDLSAHVLRSWGLDTLAEHAQAADLGAYAHGPVLAVSNRRLDLVLAAINGESRALARMMRASRQDPAWFDLAFERLALHVFGEPFVRCSALAMSGVMTMEMHMQASNLRSQAMAAQAVHAAEFDEGAQRSAEALRLLTQARNAAFAEAAQGRVGQGLSMLSEALEHEPMSHDLLSDMAALLLSAGELAHAATHAYRALELSPDHGPSLYTLGFAMSGLGEYAAAKEALVSLTQGAALASLMHEAPDLLPLVQLELQRLQDIGSSAEQSAA